MKRLTTRLILLSLVLMGCDASHVENPATSGLVITDLVPGSGALARPGDTLAVRYVGKFEDGTVFDSSLERDPFRFIVGVRQVIRGWDQGVPGMRVGGTRRLEIPPGMAYGATGVPPLIPPNAQLVFEIQLLAVRPPVKP